jgi:hypothetical protein
MKPILNMSAPDESYFEYERTWWKLFW